MPDRPGTARLGWGLVACGCLALLVAGCGSDSGAAVSRVHNRDAGPSPTTAQTISLTGYSLINEPGAAIEFSGNRDIFEARVIGSGSAKHTNPPVGQSIVYRPIDVVVTQVFQGDLQAGDRVTLTALGGTASDGTTMVYGDAWPDETWRPGTELFAFTERPVDLGAGETRTPNYLFVEQAGKAVDPLGRNPGADLAWMRAQLRRG